VSPSIYNNRLSILSSFYTHAIRKCQLLQYNPIERLDPRKVGKKDAARPLADSQVKAGLAKIDRSTVEGLRDYALLSISAEDAEAQARQDWSNDE